MIIYGDSVYIANKFRSNTAKEVNDDGFTVRCNKGLWSVTAPTEKQAETEAYHYFVQYLQDGEYDNNENQE